MSSSARKSELTFGVGPTRLAFDRFELDLRSGELSKNGRRIRLQAKPFQLLALLAERSGEVVTRDEVCRALWRTDTFVDFDHSVAAALNKIREALSDSAEKPRFIETLLRRGYRFIAPVTPVLSLASSPSAAPTRADGDVAGAGPLPVRSPRSQGAFLRRHWIIATVAAVLALAVGALLALNVGGLRGRLTTALASGPADARTNIQSIAVLPLENLSHDPQQDYFADGITDALITDLGKNGALRVISRQSMMGYKGSKKPLPQIARELNVDALVEGAVAQSGDRVRITAQLIQGHPERQLWAESYEGDLRDVLALQSRVARAVADEIKVNVEPEEQSRIASAVPVSPEAHDAYLEGRFFYYKEKRGDVLKATQYARRAIQLDPGYAPAYALLAACLFDSSEGRWGDIPNAEAYREAQAMALKALALDSSLAEPHVVLAAIQGPADRERAGQEFRKAIELNPNLVQAHVGLAWHLLHLNRNAEAVQEASRAVQIDPVSTYTLDHQIYILFFSRHYDQAVQQLHNLLEIYPDGPQAILASEFLGYSFEAKGMYDEEVAAWQKYMTLLGRKPEDVAALGRAYKVAGIRGVWQWQLNDVKMQAARGAASPVNLAALYSNLGEKDHAFEWIEKIDPQKGLDMICIRFSPAFDNLRSDQRYVDFIRRADRPPQEVASAK